MPITWRPTTCMNGSWAEVDPTGEKFVEKILEINLNDNVDIEIKRLYEVARGAMIYGFFLYPLYWFGCEQMFRIAETACRYRNDEFEDYKFKSFKYNISSSAFVFASI